MGIGLNSAICVAGMGMGAAEKEIGVIGNNLANANTTAFKSGRADFTSFLSYNYSYGSQAVIGGNAGTNPRQIGMGVQFSSVTTNFTQGTVKTGMSPTDIAINGNGFLIVHPPNPVGAPTPVSEQAFYTRNGVLKLNDSQQLTTNEGLYVMGYGIDEKFNLVTDKLVPITIPVNKLNIAEATQNVTLGGTLDAVGDTGTEGTVLRTQQMTDLSVSSPGAQKLTATQLTRPLVEGKTAATGANAAGGALEEGNYIYRFVFVDAGGRESDYSTKINASVAAGQNAATITGIPAIPEGYTGIRVYRADDPGDPTAKPPYYAVTTLGAGAGTTLTDIRSSADISNENAPDYHVLEQGWLNGEYQYYVTFVDAQGNESRPSYISDKHTVQGGQLELSEIPLPAEPNEDQWVARRIYRSIGNENTTFYRVTEEDLEMTPGMTWIDRVADEDLLLRPELSLAGGGDVLINANTKLLNVGKHENDGRFVSLFREGTLVFEPSKGYVELNGTKNTIELNEQRMTIDENTTVGDYLDFLDMAYGIRSVADDPTLPRDQGTIGSTIRGGNPGATIRDGAFYLLGNSGTANELYFNADDMYIIDAQEKRHEVDSGWKEIQTAVGSSLTSNLEVYDTLGADVAVRLNMVLESKTNTETVYRWYADSPDNQPEIGSGIAVGTGTIRFDQHGALIPGQTIPSISVERFDVASVSPATFEFHLDLGGVSALATKTPEMTQTAQDGAGAGTMYDYTINENGVVMGIFTSKVTRPVGQILLATFANQEGLFQAGDSLYQESMNSGRPVIRTPGSTGTGVIAERAVEMSNTNIGEDLINMILASSMYRANTKVMTASNEMFDQLMQIR